MRWLKRTKPEATTDDRPDCPICVHMHDWRLSDGRVQKATHGSWTADREWSACYEHYLVIGAYEWLDNTGKWGKRPWERYSCNSCHADDDKESGE